MPEFVITICCAADVVATRWSANVSVVGATMTCGLPAVQVSIDVLSPPPSVSLVNPTVAICAPVAPSGGAQRTVTGAVVLTISPAKLQVVRPAQPLPFAANVNQVDVCMMVALATWSGPTGRRAVLVTTMALDAVVPAPTIPKSRSAAEITALVPLPWSATFLGMVSAGSSEEISKSASRAPD